MKLNYYPLAKNQPKITERHLRIPKLTPEQISLFQSRIKKSINSCWKWLGARKSCGYGAFRLTDKTFIASRIAYAIFHRFDPGSWCVCHACDNPSCCNPKHLWLGTKQDNSQDNVSKIGVAD